MRVVLCLIALTSVARADDSHVSSSSQATFTLLDHFSDQKPVTTQVAPAPDPTITQIGLAGIRVGVMDGLAGISERVTFDIAIGGQVGKHGGVAYDVGLLPLGLAVKLGDAGFIALGTGVAAMGATGALDDAVLIPIQLEVEYGAGYHVMFRARDSFVFGADGRKDGAPSLPIGDELAGTLAIRAGSPGYEIGVAYQEMLGTRYVGLVIGYGLDGGF